MVYLLLLKHTHTYIQSAEAHVQTTLGHKHEEECHFTGASCCTKPPMQRTVERG